MFEQFSSNPSLSSELTAFQPMLVNPSKIVCSFEGTNDPTITWYQGSPATEIKSDDATDAYTITPKAGGFKDNVDSSELAIDLTKIKDVTAISCKITFSGINDPISTTTNVHYRGEVDFTLWKKEPDCTFPVFQC